MLIEYFLINGFSEMKNITSYDKYKYICLLFFTIFIFNFILIFQGIDVTDYGFHLTNQVQISNGNFDNRFYTMYFFSDFVGGMWLKIIGTPSILWAKFGGVLLNSLNAIIIFHILSNYFDKKKVFYVVLVTTLFITMRNSYLIHYFSFPAFMVNIELLIFNKVINTNENQTEFKLFNFLLGFVYIVIIMSRFPLILMGLLPLFLFLYYVFANKDSSKFKKSSIFISYGILFSMIIFILFYWKIGYLKTYLSNIALIISASAGGMLLILARLIWSNHLF